MTRETTLTLQRLLGLVALLFAIDALPNVIGLVVYDLDRLSMMNVPAYVAAVVVPFGLLCLLAAWLFLSPMSLVESGESDGEKGGYALAPPSQQALLLAAGVFLIGFSAMKIVPIAVRLAVRYRSEDGAALVPGADVLIWGEFVGAAIPLAIGAALVLKTSAIATLFRRRWDRTRPIAADAQCPGCGFWIVTSEYRSGAKGYRCDNCKHEIPAEILGGAAPAQES